jgi:thiamine-monophosphate kinase
MSRSSATLQSVAESVAAARLFVTGQLGGSLAGHHLDFTPRVREACLLGELVQLHSMIDITDGLVADLYHILEESGVGASLDTAVIPISTAAREAFDDRSPLEHALGDGEDFELLFSVSPDDGQRLVAHNPLTVPLTKIGVLTDSSECVLTQPSGERVPLPRLGWSHGFDEKF